MRAPFKKYTSWIYAEPIGSGPSMHKWVYDANEIDDYFVKAQEVYGWSNSKTEDKLWWSPSRSTWDDNPKATAYLVGIETIQPETAEDLLRKIHDVYYDECKKEKYGSWLNLDLAIGETLRFFKEKK